MNRDIYRGGRAKLSIDRGPCKRYFHLLWYMSLITFCKGSDLHYYMYALSAYERVWLDEQGLEKNANKDAQIAVIDEYDLMVPHLLPEGVSFLLLYPDLHADNVLLTSTESSRHSLAALIDWQNSTTGPHFSQGTAFQRTQQQCEDLVACSLQFIGHHGVYAARVWYYRLESSEIHSGPTTSKEEKQRGLDNGSSSSLPCESPILVFTVTIFFATIHKYIFE